MTNRQPSPKIVTFFLLSIFLFDDFCVSDDFIKLIIKDEIDKDTLSFFLSTLHELTQLDFYMVPLRGVKKTIELTCQSEPNFFDELRHFVKGQLSEITTDKGNNR